MGWKILAKGANWCSLTYDAVGYILSQEDMIRKRFKHTMACDEVYKQTILMNSPLPKSYIIKLMNMKAVKDLSTGAEETHIPGL